MSVVPKHRVEFLIKPTTKSRYIILMCVHYSSVLLFVQPALFTETRTAGTQIFLKFKIVQLTHLGVFPRVNDTDILP